MTDDSTNKTTPLYFGDKPQILFDNSKEKHLLFGDTNENSDRDYFTEMQKIAQLPIEETIRVREELKKSNEKLKEEIEENKKLETQLKKYQRKVKSRRVLAISVVSFAFATGLFTGLNQKENYDKFKEQIKTRIETTDENGLPKLSFLKAYALEHSEIQIDGLWYKLDYIIECAEKGEKPNPMYSYNEMNKSNEISDQYAEEYKEANGYYPNGYSK